MNDTKLGNDDTKNQNTNRVAVVGEISKHQLGFFDWRFLISLKAKGISIF